MVGCWFGCTVVVAALVSPHAAAVDLDARREWTDDPVDWGAIKAFNDHPYSKAEITKYALWAIKNLAARNADLRAQLGELGACKGTRMR